MLLHYGPIMLHYESIMDPLHTKWGCTPMLVPNTANLSCSDYVKVWILYYSCFHTPWLGGTITGKNGSILLVEGYLTCKYPSSVCYCRLLLADAAHTLFSISVLSCSCVTNLQTATTYPHPFLAINTSIGSVVGSRPTFLIGFMELVTLDKMQREFLSLNWNYKNHCAYIYYCGYLVKHCNCKSAHQNAVYWSIRIITNL